MGKKCLLPFWLRCLVLAGLVLLPLWAMAAELTIPYEVAIKGVEDGKLLKAMEAASDAFSLRDRPPASLALLRNRIEKDKDRFMEMLRSMGYYDARIETEMEAESRPVQVVFQVAMGPAYVLKSFEVKLSQPGPELPGVDRLGVSIGSGFKSEAFLDAEKKLLEILGAKGFPFAKIIDRKIVVNHEDHSVAATLLIDPGGEVRFGPVEITGLESTSETIVRRKIPWVEGAPFDADLLSVLQKELIGLGLFSMVRISHAESPDENGRLPVTITLKERKYRSIATGLSYKTDEKLGVKFAWENRNLFGEGERLGLGATISNFAYAADAGFRKPYFFREDQALALSSRLAEDKPIAYTSINLANSAVVVRDISKTLKVGGGLGFKEARVSQLGETEDFSLLFVPLQLAFDWSDNLLDPTKGGRLTFQVAPYDDVSRSDLQFLKARSSYGHYLQVLNSPSMVLAGHLTLGVVGGEDRLRIPADERFYAGGGGSIRGYTYQSLGPRAEAVPTGGRSLLELSFENRVRVTEKIGFAVFLDGGNAFADFLPSSEERLFWGAGAGIRYFTPIGPFRFDVAVPLNRREGVDDAFQVYVSIGQSF